MNRNAERDGARDRARDGARDGAEWASFRVSDMRAERGKEQAGWISTHKACKHISPVVLVYILNKNSIAGINAWYLLDCSIDCFVTDFKALGHGMIRSRAQHIKVVDEVLFHRIRSSPSCDAAMVVAMAVHDTKDSIVIIDVVEKVCILVLLGTMTRTAAMGVLEVLWLRRSGDNAVWCLTVII